MSSQTEIQYTARVRAPQVLERGRQQITDLAVYRDGALVAPDPDGTYELISPTGTVIISDTGVVVTASVATFTIPALSLPSTLAMGEGYQERWSLVMPDGTTRTFAREASLALFQLAPAITDDDLLVEYPDLIELLGSYGSNLQSWIDEAFYQFLGELYALGEWPDVIVSKAATREPLRQRAFFLIFKFMFSRQPNAGRFETLMERHEAAMLSAMSRMTYRVDRDQDGTPDDLGRHGSSTVIHLNAAPFRNRSRSNRW